eukprot:403337419
MGALCVCIGNDKQAPSSSMSFNSLTPRGQNNRIRGGPQISQILKPFFDQDKDEQIITIIEHYSSALNQITTQTLLNDVNQTQNINKIQNKELVITFGAYTELLKEIIFESTIKDRRQLINEKLDAFDFAFLEQENVQSNSKNQNTYDNKQLKDWLSSKQQYLDILRDHFSEVAKIVEDLQQQTMQILHLPIDRLFDQLDLSNLSEEEQSQIWLEIALKAKSIRIQLEQFGTQSHVQRRQSRRTSIRIQQQQERLSLINDLDHQVPSYNQDASQSMRQSQRNFDHLNQSLQQRETQQNQEITEELCQEIVIYVSDIKREQILYQNLKNQFNLEGGMNFHSELSTNEKDENFDINIIVLNGFEIEERLLNKYELTYDKLQEQMLKYGLTEDFLEDHDEEEDFERHEEIDNEICNQ